MIASFIGAFLGTILAGWFFIKPYVDALKMDLYEIRNRLWKDDLDK